MAHRRGTAIGKQAPVRLQQPGQCPQDFQAPELWAVAWRESVVQHQITAADPLRRQQRQLPAGIPQPPAAAAAPAAAPRTPLIQLLQDLPRFVVPLSAEGRIAQGQLQGAWI